MTKDRIKYFLDFVPFVILLISAIILVWTVVGNDTGFLWKQIVGLSLLPPIFFAFVWRHKIGVLVLGLTLIAGLFSLLSYSYSVTTSTLTFGKSEDTQIPIFYGQPIFLLWLLIHFIISGRHYVGIVTGKYWAELLKDSVNRSSV